MPRRQKPRFYTYQETLDLVEKFMAETLIRDYCSGICGGNCCGHCLLRGREGCQHKFGRRLPCSVFVCSLIFSKLDDAAAKKYRALTTAVNREIIFCGNFFVRRFDLYFSDITKEMQAKFQIDRQVVDEALSEDMKKQFEFRIRDLI